jgi:hypothetical protein
MLRFLCQNSNLTLLGSYHKAEPYQELKPTPNRTNLAAQSKYVYMTQEAIKTRKQEKTEL